MAGDGAARAGVPRLAVAIVVVLVAALAFIAGRIVSVAGEGAEVPVPNAADAGFARDMQVHHAQAVEMAMIVYRSTDDDDLRMMTYDMATAQSTQRGQMYGWLQQWGLPQAGDPLMSWMSGSGHDHAPAGEPLTEDELLEAMGMATPDELSRLQQATGIEQACLFLDLMTTHHAGAVEMVDAIEELGSVPVVLDTARSMGESQQAEIDAMASMGQRLGCG